MDSFFMEYGTVIVEFMFLYMVYRILYSVLEIVWGLPL